MFSRSSSIWSPVLAVVPPVRITSRRDVARAHFVGGIEEVAGADQGETADQGEFVVLQKVTSACRWGALNFAGSGILTCFSGGYFRSL